MPKTATAAAPSLPATESNPFAGRQALPGYVIVKERPDIAESKSAGGIVIPGAANENALVVGEVYSCAEYVTRKGFVVLPPGWIKTGALVQFRKRELGRGDAFRRTVAGQIFLYVQCEDVMAVSGDGRDWSAAPMYVLYRPVHEEDDISAGGIHLPNASETNSKAGECASSGMFILKNSGQPLYAEGWLERGAQFERLGEDARALTGHPDLLAMECQFAFEFPTVPDHLRGRPRG